MLASFRTRPAFYQLVSRSCPKGEQPLHGTSNVCCWIRVSAGSKRSCQHIPEMFLTSMGFNSAICDTERVILERKSTQNGSRHTYVTIRASTAIIYFEVDYLTSVNLTEGTFDILNRNMCQIQGVKSSYGSEWYLFVDKSWFFPVTKQAHRSSLVNFDPDHCHRSHERQTPEGSWGSCERLIWIANIEQGLFQNYRGQECLIV